MRRFSCSARCAAVFAVVAAMVMVAASAPAWGQLSTTATIAGNVTDATGALVPDATVTATDEATKITTERQTGPDGSYVIPSLPVDTYSISISKAGFNTYTVSGIVLHPATTANINGALQPGSVTDKITVTAAAVQVETSTSEISTEVNSAQVSTLPMNGPGAGNSDAGRAEHIGGKCADDRWAVDE